MKKAFLYKRLSDNQVQCNLCNHRCIISESKRGICQVRENKKGRLFSLVYGKAIACNIDPIEKKPLYHFLPGTNSLSIATIGCNFKCPHCQNWQISQQSADNQEILAEKDLSPQEIVEQAIENNCQSIAYTYTEPTVFLEYALETMKLAKIKKVKNIWVSNGYFTEEALNLIAPYLDAINLDLKSFSEEFYQKYCQARLKPVLENSKRIKEKKIWLEITTLIIPGLNDSERELEQIAEFINSQLGSETPWHISRFFPAYKKTDLPPTLIQALIKARQIGIEQGLMYVYIGNVPNHPADDTYCSECKTLMIERTDYQIKRFDKNGKCSKCGESLDIIE